MKKWMWIILPLILSRFYPDAEARRQMGSLRQQVGKSNTIWACDTYPKGTMRKQSLSSPPLLAGTSPGPWGSRQFPAQCIPSWASAKCDQIMTEQMAERCSFEYGVLHPKIYRGTISTKRI